MFHVTVADKYRYVVVLLNMALNVKLSNPQTVVRNPMDAFRLFKDMKYSENGRCIIQTDEKQKGNVLQDLRSFQFPKDGIGKQPKGNVVIYERTQNSFPTKKVTVA